MAKKYGTYKCGHEGILVVDYSNRHRYDSEEKIEKYFATRVCKECYRKQIEESRRLEAEKAKEEAKKLELPELIGSEKQVNWAVTIRKDMLDKWENRLKFENDTFSIKPYDIINDIIKYSKSWVGGVEGREIAEMLIKEKEKSNEEQIELCKDIVFGALCGVTKAKTFIDLKTTLCDYFEIFTSLLYNSYKKLKSEAIEEISKGAVIIPDAELKDERIIKICSGVRNTIFIDSYKEEGLISLFKESYYKWNGNSVCWYRKIESTNGDINDRKVEIANKILNAGYPVKIDDETLRDRIINAEYEPEHRRWIDTIFQTMDHADVKMLAVIFDKNEEIYNEFKKIKGSKWSKEHKKLLIPMEMYKEVQRLARRYDFNFSSSADNTISFLDDEFNKRVVVKNSPTDIDEPDLDKQLEDLLNSEAVVLPDLED